MTTQSKFYYPVTVHQDSAQFPDVAPFVMTLPSPQQTEELVCILSMSSGDLAQGVYVFDGIQWKFAMPMLALSSSIIRGDSLDFYVYPTVDGTAPPAADVYKNGILQSNDNIAHGQAVYAVRNPPAGGGGGGAVNSVNGQTGVVIVNATNLPGLSAVGKSNQYADLFGLPAPYALTPASASILGGVIIPPSSKLVVDGSGNIDVGSALITTITNKIGSVVSSGAGTSAVRSVSASIATLKSFAAGTNIGIVDDGAGTLTFSSTVPIATSSILGGVKQGTNITIAGDGTISAAGYSLPIATAGILGGVKAGAGLAVAGDGTLSVSSTYTLPQASSSVLGGIKVGSTLTIAGDGTLDANMPAAATTSVIGLVKPGTGLTVTIDGTLNASAAIPATVSTLGVVKIGTGVSVAGDGTISVAFPVASVNAKTGAVQITAGNGITVNNGGANIVVALNLASSDVVTALGYTPYNGATNPNSYLTANQNITYTGDATGAGTTNVALTLANSGVAAGSFTKVTVDAKGRVTTGSNPTTLVGYGITDALSIHGGSVDGNITLTSGATITNIPTPVANSDAANRLYVDNAIASIASGVTWRANAQVASTANIVLAGLQTIDGYAVQANDRVLVKDQISQIDNGVYVAGAGAWTRGTDTDTGAELLNMAILVLNGTTQGRSQWVNSNTSAITVGVTNITFAELQGPAVAYTAGVGLTLTGNQFSISNTGVTASTFTKVTVNAQGQVTAGTQLNSADVTTALGFTPYNSTNPAGYISTNQNITVTGDATGSGTTAITLTLANSGATPGTFKSVTVDVKGRVTSGTNPNTLAGFGITDALSNTGGNVSGSINLTSGATITNVPTPAAGTDAANKTYADTVGTNTFNSVAWKTRVAVTTTANIALTGLQTIDGYAVQAGDRVLVKDQTTQTQNGVYVASAGAWARAVDAAAGANLIGLVAIVLNGTVGALTQYLNTNTSAITVGTTNITFSQTAAAGTAYTAGIGLTLTANQFSITNTGVAASTFTKVTVNAQGQVTAGTQLNSSDVTTALGFTPLSTNQTITLSGDVTGSGTTAITATLANTAVTPGGYGDATHIATFTVDSKGRLTAAGQVSISAGVSSVFGQTGAVPNLSGDVTTSGSSATTLANSGVTAGTYTKVTVDVKGRVTLGTAFSSSDVTTALGYTPQVTSADLTAIAALGVGSTVGILSKGVGADADPNYTSVALLLHMDGSNGATSTTDNSPSPLTGTFQGASTLSTTQKKFGTAALAGSTAVPNGITYATDARFNCGQSQYTIEGWFYPTDVVSSGSQQVMWMFNGAAQYSPWFGIFGPTMYLRGSNTSNDIVTPFLHGMSANTWYYIEVIKNGATWSIYINNTLVASGSGFTVPSESKSFSIGGGTVATGFSGFTDEVRLTAGVARAGGVTPSAPFGNSTTGSNAWTFGPTIATSSINGAPTVTLASAGTVAIGAAAANDISVTGTSTITAFDTIAAGAERKLTFTGILTLTHNASSLILPTGANIITAAGDGASFTSIGGGNWRCDYYQRASGQSLVGAPDATKLPLAGGTMSGALNEAPLVTLASAGTTNIGAAAANTISITGTTTITAFDTIAAGAIRRLVFGGILTLTQNATALILPGAANIITAAGDIAEFVSLGAGNWRCLYYTKASSVAATLAGTETLTNKTLTNDTITGFIESGAAATGSAFSPDFTTGTDFEYTTNANTTITLPTPVAGRSYTITIIYGGAHTVTFSGGGTIKYAGGTAPTATSVTGKRDYYVCKCDRAAAATSVFDGGRNF